MTFSQWKVFKTVLDMQNVTLAAAALYMTQPSATQQIRALEKSLGLKLFERAGGRLIPTNAALRLRPLVEQTLEWVTHIEREAVVLRKHSGGRIILGLNTTGGMYIMPPVIRAFIRSHPDIIVDLKIESTNEICSQVLQGRIDFGFAGGPIDGRQFEVHRLGLDSLALVLSPEHALAREQVINQRALELYRFILPEVGSRTRLVFEGRIRDAGLSLDSVLSLASTEAVKKAAESNIGIGVVSKSATRLEQHAGKLLVRDLEGIDLARGFEVFWARSVRRSKHASTFVDFVISEFSKHQPLGAEVDDGRLVSAL